jgi:amino acid transporter
MTLLPPSHTLEGASKMTDQSPLSDTMNSVEPEGDGHQMHRSIGLIGNLALGFTYLSPLVGIFSLFVFGLTTAGPTAMWWLPIIAAGQMLVALVFGDVVSQFPIAGGIYPWVRRLWGRKPAWMAAWIYLAALTVTLASVVEFAAPFVGSLFGFEATPLATLAVASGLLILTLLINLSGTAWLGRVARLGLFAELIGVVGVGLYLLIFERHNDFSVFFDTMGAMGNGSSLSPFIAAALVGLWMFYGFEACGDVAEEVHNPSRRIPLAMILTIVVGLASALIGYMGYVLAAPNLQDIVDGKVADPISAILQASLGDVGVKIFLCVALLSFISATLSLQAALSRLIWSFSRDDMMPGSRWLKKLTSGSLIPQNAVIVACIIPLLVCIWALLQPGSLTLIAAFGTIAIYVCFQMVVFASLRNRLRGWRPAGEWTLGSWGLPINILALVYGIAAMILLAWPGSPDLAFMDRWIVLIGLAVILGVGALYMVIARPYDKSHGPENDAIEIAEKIRAGKFHIRDGMDVPTD